MENENNVHVPGFTTPLEESAQAEELERIKNDPRRRAIALLEDEELAAARAIANATALMRRNAKVRAKLSRELREDYTRPEVRSFVPDPAGPSFFRRLLVPAVAVVLLAGVYGLSVFANANKKLAAVVDAAAGVQVAHAAAPVEAPTPEPKPEPVKVEAPRPAPKKNTTGLPTQEQKDAAADACRKIAANRAGIYDDFNISPEQFATTCYYDVLAIAWTESRFDCSTVGDNGRSHGCFQIQTRLHHVSVADAENFAFAAEWTMDRMARDTGYPRYRTASLARHNGSGDAAANYAALVKAKAAEYQRLGL